MHKVVLLVWAIIHEQLFFNVTLPNFSCNGLENNGPEEHKSNQPKENEPFYVATLRPFDKRTMFVGTNQFVISGISGKWMRPPFLSTFLGSKQLPISYL